MQMILSKRSLQDIFEMFLSSRTRCALTFRVLNQGSRNVPEGGSRTYYTTPNFQTAILPQLSKIH